MENYGEEMKKIYDNGKKIEGFVLLHMGFETLLNSIWFTFLRNEIKSKTRLTERTFLDLIGLLYETNLLTKTEFSILNNFHKGRNSIIHNVNSIYKEVDPKQLDNRFNRGVKIIPKIWEKYRQIALKYNPADPLLQIKQENNLSSKENK